MFVIREYLFLAVLPEWRLGLHQAYTNGYGHAQANLVIRGTAHA